MLERNRNRSLLKRNNAIAGKLLKVELWLVIERHEGFGTKRRFVDLPSDLFADVRQTWVGSHCFFRLVGTVRWGWLKGKIGVGRVATEDKPLHTKSFAGTKDCPDIVR